MVEPLKPSQPPGHLFCFGVGYSAERLARRLIRQGWCVSGTVQSSEKQAALEAIGIATHLFGPRQPLVNPKSALEGVTHIVSSIPPKDAGDPVLRALEDYLQAAASLAWIGYLSTPAVYGDRQGALTRESDAPNPGSARGRRRLAAEEAWIEAFDGTAVAVQVFRLSGIYGPGKRNALAQVKAGSARIIDKPGQVFNRIHVDDIGSILIASMDRPAPNRVYNVADTEACPSGDIIRHACALLGVEPPAPIDFNSAELSAMARSFYSECKRLDTTRLTAELGVVLGYPTYREGLAAINASLGSECSEIT
jgi:nucleoside-diphosphate-sugar epimerase